MAIMWKLKLTPIDVVKRIGSVIATRTDDTDLQNIDIKIYSVARVLFNTQAEQLAVLDEIWEKHQTALVVEEQVQEFLDNLELLGEQYLEARE